MSGLNPRAPFASVLIANRGEIALRIQRAAAELGMLTVAVHPQDDAASLHVQRADSVQPLAGKGAAAYLDVAAVMAAAQAAGCDALHPGYGFLAENPALARACAAAGITFVGPGAELLESLGDKVRCRALAAGCGVPVLAATGAGTTLADVEAFRASLGPDAALMLKAAHGGGGRGMRRVEPGDDLAAAFARCCSEAEKFFGRADVYAEELVRQARHIEIQIVGDGSSVSHVYERECTLQRAHQKLVEIAPSPTLSHATRERLQSAAVRMASELAYTGLCTFEFLVDAEDGERFAFIEANPRLQVEHTVTEEISGVDLVRAQLEIAGGRTLADLGLLQTDLLAPRGYAVQCRINTERMDGQGRPLPSGGTLSIFEPPTGPGLRTDTCGHGGFTTHPGFDSLLAKLVAHSTAPRFEDALTRARRGLEEFRIEGVPTNRDFLRALLEHPDVVANRVTTSFVESHAEELASRAARFAEAAAGKRVDPNTGFAGARIDTRDPLAVLDHGRAPVPATASVPRTPAPAGDGNVPVPAPVQGTIVSLEVSAADTVLRSQPLVVMEAMKMEHVVAAPVGGRIVGVQVEVGETVLESHPLVFIEEDATLGDARSEASAVDSGRIRPDLQESLDRHALGLDANRPKAVERRRKTGQRTARENVEDLCDAGSFIEYGPLALAAQRRRRSLEELIHNTPADGMVTGVGSVNGALFPDADARCAILAYDYTVLAGTQGFQNHRKKDRLFEVARDWRLPLVIFTEGGGGRPGDTDGISPMGLDTWAFHYFAELSGLVPLVGINSGRCFAGNAVLLGCCDVVIATANSNIGMGGPAMIEGGGLGIFRPEEVGPIDVQVGNGVVDIAVADEAEAVDAAKRYLGYFQGTTQGFECADQQRLRSAIPENRLRIYDVRQVIETLADTGSVLELRRGFGPGMVTALARVEGRPLGLIANDPTHLAGAIDSDGADKASRFMQLCDAFDVPLLFLCDTPGIMVGPEAEKSGTVRHAARMFVVGSNLTIPFFTIVLRKGYGLGAMAMAGGTFKAPFFCVSWPTGEFGGMGLEGAVKLGFRRELEAQSDPTARRALYEKLLAQMYDKGKAVSTASYFEIDDVIDPADSRDWIGRALRSVPPTPPRTGKKRACVDTW